MRMGPAGENMAPKDNDKLTTLQKVLLAGFCCTFNESTILIVFKKMKLQQT